MPCFFKRTVTNLILLLLAVGCHSSPTDSNSSRLTSNAPTDASTSQQLIIKFKPDTIACSPEGIARLSLATRVSLEFIRQMSGQACVVKQLAGSAEGISKGQTLLKQHPSIEWVEPDALMKAQ
jgi:hypothetical protein